MRQFWERQPGDSEQALTSPPNHPPFFKQLRDATKENEEERAVHHGAAMDSGKVFVFSVSSHYNEPEILLNPFGVSLSFVLSVALAAYEFSGFISFFFSVSPCGFVCSTWQRLAPASLPARGISCKSNFNQPLFLLYFMAAPEKRCSYCFRVEVLWSEI